MPRPRKCRKVCRLPAVREFTPVCPKGRRKPSVVLTVEEYETIRLIDYQGFSQEDCGAYMQVARTTVQQMYTQARQKIAYTLVQGVPLKIQGGQYELCDGQERTCNCGGCAVHRCEKTNLMEETTL